MRETYQVPSALQKFRFKINIAAYGVASVLVAPGLPHPKL